MIESRPDDQMDQRVGNRRSAQNSVRPLRVCRLPPWWPPSARKPRPWIHARNRAVIHLAELCLDRNRPGQHPPVGASSFRLHGTWRETHKARKSLNLVRRPVPSALCGDRRHYSRRAHRPGSPFRPGTVVVPHVLESGEVLNTNQVWLDVRRFCNMRSRFIACHALRAVTLSDPHGLERRRRCRLLPRCFRAWNGDRPLTFPAVLERREDPPVVLGLRTSTSTALLAQGLLHSGRNDRSEIGPARLIRLRRKAGLSVPDRGPLPATSCGRHL